MNIIVQNSLDQIFMSQPQLNLTTCMLPLIALGHYYLFANSSLALARGRNTLFLAPGVTMR